MGVVKQRWVRSQTWLLADFADLDMAENMWIFEAVDETYVPPGLRCHGRKVLQRVGATKIAPSTSTEYVSSASSMRILDRTL